MKILLRFVVVFILIAAVFVAAHFVQKKDKVDEIAGEMLVAVNEIQNGDEAARARFAELRTELITAADGDKAFTQAMWLSVGICAFFAFYLYIAVLHPFYKLEKFSQDLAVGNYNIRLDMPRHNVFGAFSWAFDSMREGLYTAQKAELEARDANKTLIAALSHDIITPISSIKACAEALSLGQDASMERKQRYLDILRRRSDEVARLTNDLFVHAISDMDKPIIEPKELSLRSFLLEFAALMDVVFPEDIPDVKVLADEKRLKEVFGNIVQNAQKYAPAAPVEVTFMREDVQTEGLFYCVFSDQGMSLSPEDVPFIFYKFYRGKNAVNVDGSGLGLYIARYLAEKQGGKAYAQRTEEGLKIFIGLRVSS